MCLWRAVLQKKIFSSIFLTGKGFARTDWAPEFMKQICNRRRVFVETAIFAKGAAMKAEEYLDERVPGLLSASVREN